MRVLRVLNPGVVFVLVLGLLGPAQGLADGSATATGRDGAVTAPVADRAQLRLGDQLLSVEIADTDPLRMQGLMFRKHLGENEGMLFIWPRPQRVAMWMKDTHIPLSVAFIDQDLRIRNIAHMDPLSLQSHPSLGPVQFALEVNRGWFEAHGVRPGQRIDDLQNLLRERAPENP